ncbi:protein RKD1 [Artemisia annua]|uniref:Protein RKD1 n=1 Tax=Artemisia annua TaxID=35608 RepID=A0A2U1P6Z8_ARTAN|nr:protein RKD1 [Artemisia annua]
MALLTPIHLMPASVLKLKKNLRVVLIRNAENGGSMVDDYTEVIITRLKEEIRRVQENPNYKLAPSTKKLRRQNFKAIYKRKKELNLDPATTIEARPLESITKEEIAQYFHLPIPEAASKLNVGLTVLKKCCRDMGFKRWPHRTLNSLDLLINTLQVRMLPLYLKKEDVEELDTEIGEEKEAKAVAPEKRRLKKLSNEPSLSTPSKPNEEKTIKRDDVEDSDTEIEEVTKKRRVVLEDSDTEKEKQVKSKAGGWLFRQRTRNSHQQIKCLESAGIRNQVTSEACKE